MITITPRHKPTFQRLSTFALTAGDTFIDDNGKCLILILERDGLGKPQQCVLINDGSPHIITVTDLCSLYRRCDLTIQVKDLEPK